MSDIDKKIEDEVEEWLAQTRLPGFSGIRPSIRADKYVMLLIDELKATRERCANGKCDGYDKGYLDSKYEVELIEHRTKEACEKAALNVLLVLGVSNVIWNIVRGAIRNCKAEGN